MAKILDFAAVDERMAWLQSASLTSVVDDSLEALRAGVDEDILWASGMLTATHFVNNQAHILLGFVSHAAIGCEDARRLAQHQIPRIRHLLLLQALHQVVFDMHEPCMSPDHLLPCGPLYEDTIEQNIRMLRADIRRGEYSRSDYRFNALERELPRDDLIGLLLDIGLEGMTTDDHTLITPALSLGMLELVGWERGFDMLRCALRYSASFPRNFAPYDRADELAARYDIASGVSASGLQPDRIQVLRQTFHDTPPEDRPAAAARALAEEGFSPETILAAVSLTGCDYYLMVEPVPHDDFDAVSREVAPIHMGTSTNALRSMVPYMSPRTQVLAAIQGGSLLQRGPSVLNADFEFVPFKPARAFPYSEDVRSLNRQSPEQFIRTLKTALYAHDYQLSTAVVQAYADAGTDPAWLIAALTEVACTDDGTLMHNIKHLNSMVEEFQSCQHPDRWNYLIVASRFIAWYAGKRQSVYAHAVTILQEQTEDDSR
ncbi:MAG: hypothetical protein K8J31_20310 [Anaerolineae bacterium]|nr:hypothetical protein [Anaerolineae bacterium]